jgi:hypothetical protein
LKTKIPSSKTIIRAFIAGVAGFELAVAFLFSFSPNEEKIKKMKTAADVNSAGCLRKKNFRAKKIFFILPTL